MNFTDIVAVSVRSVSRNVVGWGMIWGAVRYDPDIHHRRSIRLDGYDYSLGGAYFFTVVAQDRECLFGHVEAEEMRHNPAGEMIVDAWRGLTARFPSLLLDAFVAMPNHVHGVVVLDQSDRRFSAAARSGPDGPRTPELPTLGEVVGAFKSTTTVHYSRQVVQNGWQPFRVRLWQRNFYERIIRNRRELDAIRQYIAENPLKWHLDQENPINHAQR